MDVMTPQLLQAQVMHKRLMPRVNEFCYGVYYLAIPLQSLHDGSLARVVAVDRHAVTSFFRKDHGPRDGGSLAQWAKDILDQNGLNDVVRDVTLICMPRILGYVFNPVSFWLCMDAERQIRAVICEVNNTFGESHSYLCAHKDGRVITPKDRLKAEKLFFVSPFIERQGSYSFRFFHSEQTFSAHIDYYDENGQKLLATALTGTNEQLTKGSLRAAFWRHPLVTFKAIGLIHYQAIKLLLKRIRYIVKPPQRPERTSRTL